MRIVERTPAHYETEEVGDLGRVYRWCPEQAVLECGACGWFKGACLADNHYVEIGIASVA